MIERKEIEPLLNKEIGILYTDSGKDLYAKGFLLNVTDTSIKLETKYNVLIISLASIEKIKCSKL